MTSSYEEPETTKGSQLGDRRPRDAEDDRVG